MTVAVTGGDRDFKRLTSVASAMTVTSVIATSVAVITAAMVATVATVTVAITLAAAEGALLRFRLSLNLRYEGLLEAIG